MFSFHYIIRTSISLFEQHFIACVRTELQKIYIVQFRVTNIMAFVALTKFAPIFLPEFDLDLNNSFQFLTEILAVSEHESNSGIYIFIRYAHCWSANNIQHRRGGKSIACNNPGENSTNCKLMSQMLVVSCQTTSNSYGKKKQTEQYDVNDKKPVT